MPLMAHYGSAMIMLNAKSGRALGPNALPAGNDSPTDQRFVHWWAQLCTQLAELKRQQRERELMFNSALAAASENNKG